MKDPSSSSTQTIPIPGPTSSRVSALALGSRIKVDTPLYNGTLLSTGSCTWSKSYSFKLSPKAKGVGIGILYCNYQETSSLAKSQLSTAAERAVGCRRRRRSGFCSGLQQGTTAAIVLCGGEDGPMRTAAAGTGRGLIEVIWRSHGLVEMGFDLVKPWFGGG
ncbi:hypothetical protein M0R45_008099 [Rubus argutus]|uniref:Uncharacterized protein n=1 Tax=Rubus argutus TaxID=59490 RepID=A0AAW1Y076_RUBAR